MINIQQGDEEENKEIATFRIPVHRARPKQGFTLRWCIVTVVSSLSL